MVTLLELLGARLGLVEAGVAHDCGVVVRLLELGRTRLVSVVTGESGWWWWV